MTNGLDIYFHYELFVPLEWLYMAIFIYFSGELTNRFGVSLASPIQTSMSRRPRNYSSLPPDIEFSLFNNSLK